MKNFKIIKCRSLSILLFAICAGFLFLGLVEKANAATYYSDYASGSDANNGTSTGMPWKFAPGMSGWTGSAVLSNGDTVVLKGGITWTFASTTANLWTLPAEITVQGGQQLASPWGSGYPVLDGAGSTGRRTGISSSGKSNIVIDGIKIYKIGVTATGEGAGITFSSGSDIEVKNCVLDTYAVTAFHYGVFGNWNTTSKIYFHHNTVSNSGRVTIQVDNNTVDDVRLYNNTLLGSGDYNPMGFHCDGFMIGGDRTTADYAITNLKIYNNRFIGDWTAGATAQIYLNGGPKSVLNAAIRDAGSGYSVGDHVRLLQTGSNSYGTVDVTSIGAGGSITGVRVYFPGNGYTTADNLATSCSGYPSSCAGAGSGATIDIVAGQVYSTNNVEIYNNLFSAETGASFFSPGMITIYNGRHSNYKIYNNTLDATLMTTAPTCLSAILVDNIDIRNNIFSGCDNAVIISATCSGAVIVDSNLFYTRNANHLIWDGRPNIRYDSCAAVQAAGFGATFCEESAPNYVKAPTDGIIGSGDWRLQATSNAIGHGVDLSATIGSTDILGETRSGTWDIGAYEYSGDTPPPTPSCGDGTCNGQETCASCPSDCGVCPPTTYNITDFTNLLADWLQTKISPADVNTDGKVNSQDLGIMMSQWEQ